MVGRGVEGADHLLLEALARGAGFRRDDARLELDRLALVVLLDLLGTPLEVEERLEVEELRVHRLVFVMILYLSRRGSCVAAFLSLVPLVLVLLCYVTYF